MSGRQRRGLLLLTVAVVGAFLTFVAVLRYTESVAAQLGPRRAVVVAVREVPAYTVPEPADLEVRQVPVVFAPPGALGSVQQVRGRVSPLALPPGTFLQEAGLTAMPAVGAGQRALTVLADGAQSLAGSIAVGDLVDVIAGYGTDAGGDARVEIDDVSVVAVTAPRDETADGVFVTLAVSPAQALALARGQAADATFVVVRRPPREVEP